MKIKSLLLGSVAMVGATAAASAADLGVLTSLDVCDAVNVTGLTLSSDSNCLAISGGVEYNFTWGDYKGAAAFTATTWNGTGAFHTTSSGTGTLDWDSSIEAWLRFVGTADSDFGNAVAAIQIAFTSSVAATATAITVLNPVVAFSVTEAFVAVGNETVLTAGLTDGVANFDDDAPLNWLGLFGASDVDTGVAFLGVTGTNSYLSDGGHVITLTSDLGDGLSVGVGLENLADTNPLSAGTLVGVVAYDGDGVTAHMTVLAGGVLDGAVEMFGVHAGATLEFDEFTVRGAVAADSSGWWNVLGTASATFDMFTIAVSGEALSTTAWGVGGSVTAEVVDGVTLNVGGRYWVDAAGGSIYEIAAGVDADVTETVALSGLVGYKADAVPTNVFYAELGATWAPGGGFEAGLTGRINSNAAYSIAFSASKDFE